MGLRDSIPPLPESLLKRSPRPLCSGKGVQGGGEHVLAGTSLLYTDRANFYITIYLLRIASKQRWAAGESALYQWLTTLCYSYISYIQFRHLFLVSFRLVLFSLSSLV